MGGASDDEEDIWNYTVLTKAKSNTQQPFTKSRRLSKSHVKTKPQNVKNISVCMKKSSLVTMTDCDHANSGTVSTKLFKKEEVSLNNTPTAFPVIDVEEEHEQTQAGAIVSDIKSFTSGNSEVKLQERQKTAAKKLKSFGSALIYDECKSAKGPVIRKSRKCKLTERRGQNKVGQKGSPIKSSQEKINMAECASEDISHYFSPHKANTKKRKSTEPLQILISSDDEDLSIEGEEIERKSVAVEDLVISEEESQKKSNLQEKSDDPACENVKYVKREEEMRNVCDTDSKDDSENSVLREGAKAKCQVKTSAKVVDVVVLMEKSTKNNQDKDVDNMKSENFESLEQQQPEGFFMDEVDLFEESDEEEYVSEKNLPVSSGNGFFEDLPCNNRRTNKNEDDSHNKPQLSKWLNPSAILAGPQKQTSIFSFFKAKFSSPSTSKKTQNKEASVEAKLYPVTARPSLCKQNTVGASASTPFTTWQERPELKKSASETEASKGWRKRQCPFYKKIPGTKITVDAFRYGVIPDCEAYVLTHFHYDHYGGLTKKFAQPLYCSQVTANLVESRLGVDTKWVNPLPLWKPCQVAGVTLTLMEANHCPGAVIILFETKDGRKLLHTGDFRACPEMEEYSVLKGVAISELYLDTTYCNPMYAFPPQKEVIDFVVSLVMKHLADHPKTLIVCGTYTIGKERIFTAIAEALDRKVCVMHDKKKVLDCLDDPKLKSRLTLNWSEGQVHVLPMNKLNQKSLLEHLHRHKCFTSLLAFQPTGWTHSNKTQSLDRLRPKWSVDGVTLYGVPYSEHSSFLELKRFVQYVRPAKILPTVNNGSAAAREKMEALFQQWMKESNDNVRSMQKVSQQGSLEAWIT